MADEGDPGLLSRHDVGSLNHLERRRGGAADRSVRDEKSFGMRTLRLTMKGSM